MLPEFYIEYLKTYLPSSEFLTLQILVLLLQVHRQVRIERLASSFPYPIKCESRRKKIQRFLMLPRLSLPLLWFPLIKKIISTQYKKGDRLIITIDRTQWKHNNISMASVIWKKRALPIYWLLLDKKGSSNFYEQVATIRPVLKLLKDYKLVVIGDREYRSTAFALWLTNLIFLIAIAYTASCLTGLKIRNTGHQEYINRLELEGKNRPRHSYFWTGLYGTTWILSMDICWEWVEKLMRTAINKLPFYQRGLRAMKHIQSIV